MPDSSFDTLQLETPRLILRVPSLADLDGFAALMADEENARFIGGVAPREMTWRALMTMIGAWHARASSMFSVFEKSSGRWVGRLGPWKPEGWPGTEVGWAIVRDCWGRGYATEGAAAAMDLAFDRLGWTDIIHTSRRTTSPRNRSRASWARESRSRPTAAAVSGRAGRHLGSVARGVAGAAAGVSGFGNVGLDLE